MIRYRKGYTLIELLVVVLIIALIMMLVSIELLKEIDRARGSTLISEARVAYNVAHSIIVETIAEGWIISDELYMEGLTGTVDDASRPGQSKLSRRMAELTEPDIVFSDEISHEAARVAFTIENSIITALVYEKMVDKRHYKVTLLMSEGETVVERVRAVNPKPLLRNFQLLVCLSVVQLIYIDKIKL